MGGGAGRVTVGEEGNSHHRVNMRYFLGLSFTAKPKSILFASLYVYYIYWIKSLSMGTCAPAKSLRSYPTLCDPIDGNPCRDTLSS